MAATSNEEEFLTDLQKCLDLADQLKKDSSDDPSTQQVVSEQLKQLQDCLKQKTQENEERTTEQIEKEKKEIENLKNRIERATQSKENAGDVVYADLDELWHDLKNEYWQTAFNTYRNETKKSAEFILESLLEILQVTYAHCKNKAREKQDEIAFLLNCPGEAIPNKKEFKSLKNVDSELLQKSIRRCQTRSIPFCLSSVQETLTKELEADKSIVKQFKAQKEALKKDLTRYLEKCVEFCWIAAFEEPEILFVTKPMKECKRLKDRFPDLEKTIKKQKVVEWPALVQANRVRTNWKLYPPDKLESDSERRADNGHRKISSEDKQGGEMKQPLDEVDGKKDNPTS